MTRFRRSYVHIKARRVLWLLAWLVQACQPSTAGDLAGCGSRPGGALSGEGRTATAQLRYRVIRSFAHDPQAFTQGLVYEDGFLYESTGLRGKSSVRRVELESGVILSSRKLARELFGEGLTAYKDRLIQLSWRAGIGLVYARDSLETIRRFRYRGEGWGITSLEDHLVMSDGSEVLRWFSPENFKEVSRLAVTDAGMPLRGLNELEYVDGRILANVYPGDCIAEIDPESGSVTGWLDLSELYPAMERNGREQVLNGIAYDRLGRRLFVTGKHWPRIYQLQLLVAGERN